MALLFWDGASEDIKIGAGQGALMIFIGILPLANGLLDWLSLGVTRRLLCFVVEEREDRSGLWAVLRGQGSVLIGLVDLVIAVLFFFLMAMMTVTVLALAVRLHALGGVSEPLFDTAALLAGLRDNPTSVEYWWVYAMLGTTLIPTVIHFGVVCYGLRAAPASDEIARRLHALWTKVQDRKAKGENTQGLNAHEATKLIGRIEFQSIMIPGVLVTGALWLFIEHGTVVLGATLRSAEAVNAAIQTWDGWPLITPPAD